MKDRQTYYPAYDYRRMVLSLTVALEHSDIFFWDQSANFAVQVCFALSGWLIGGILLRSTPRQLPRFYFDRAARIWIPYFLAIALLMSASLLKEPITAKWLEIFFYDSTFVYNFFGPPQLAAHISAMPLGGTGNHFWSICAEEQFYLVAPLLITMFARRSIWFWSVAGIAALASPVWNFFGSISLGVLAAAVQFKFPDWQTRLGSRVALLIASIAILSATYLGPIAYRLGAPLSAISIVLCLAQAGNQSGFAKFLGGVSYPMYRNIGSECSSPTPYSYDFR